MTWRDAVLAALRSYSTRHETRMVERQQFMADELANITEATGSSGLTPQQTLSRILQELRDEGLVEFLGPGQYLLLDGPLDVEAEDFTDEAIDIALRANKLRLGTIATGDQIVAARRRKGQNRLRRLVTQAYGSRCAVCDITAPDLLIASHILGWAEAPEHRGDLTNVICLCRIHDPLFERGYWSLDDRFEVVRRATPGSRTIRLVLEQMETFRPPSAFLPGMQFLREHRTRFGFSA